VAREGTALSAAPAARLLAPPTRARLAALRLVRSMVGSNWTSKRYGSEQGRGGGRGTWVYLSALTASLTSATCRMNCQTVKRRGGGGERVTSWRMRAR
jgi:hypothetical protein